MGNAEGDAAQEARGGDVRGGEVCGDDVRVVLADMDDTFLAPDKTLLPRNMAMLDRLAEDLKPWATVEQQPLMEGRNMHMLIAPLPASVKKKNEKAAAVLARDVRKTPDVSDADSTAGGQQYKSEPGT